MGLGSPEQPDLIQRGPATAEGGRERYRQQPHNEKGNRHELCALRSSPSGPLVFESGKAIAGIAGWEPGRGKESKRGVRPG